MPDFPSFVSPRDLVSARRAAKSLRRTLHAGDPAALARFQAVFGRRRDPAAACHADCLHVVAREAGAESWPRLKLAVEAAAMTREQRVAALERAVTSGNAFMSGRLLALDASLADAHLGLQLALRRRDAALAALAVEPGLATRPIGRRWPIHHVCYSKHEPGSTAVAIELLDALLAAGADVNQGFPAEPGSDHLLSPLYGALGHAGDLELAAALLERGADPNDNESLYHATELDSLDGVALLFRHGAEVGRTNAFYRMLDRESVAGTELFLAHGADPNAPLFVHPTDDGADRRNALHHAILRGRSAAIGALLLDHGADAMARFEGRTAYALAVASGNASMVRLLEERGLATPLGAEERLMAAIMAGDGARARALLEAEPGLLDRLGERDLQRPTELAMDARNLSVLRLMAELGFDPDRPGESGMPPIHAAAWWGHVPIVELYLERGVDLERTNMYGGTALGTAIHGSANCPGRERGDYPRTVALLLKAGARLRPEAGDLEMGSPEVTLLLEAWPEVP